MNARSQPNPRRPAPLPPVIGPAIPLVKRRWLLILAAALEALWLTALAVLALR
jgi:hypothetical protein